MIKLAFLIRSLNYGGAQRQLVTLAKAVDKKYFDVTVLHFYSGGPVEKDLQDAGIKLICLEKQGRWELFSFFSRLVHHLKEIQPDILHGYLVVPNLLTICLKPLFPSIPMIWGIRASNMDLNHYDWTARLTFQLQCLLSPFTDLIILNSNAGKTYHLEHGFPANKMVVIPNGINTELFRPNSEARLKVRKEWGIAQDTILIGKVGRLDPMKDHPTFLKAAALLSQKQQNVKFVCIGKGEENYTAKLYKLTDELGISEKVIWAGARKDMPAVYNALDIATSTSSYGEGFPNVVGEAMACGIPCVVTDVGDSAWIVSDTGIVVPPKNPHTLTAGWISCLEINRDEIGVKARERIVEHFSIEHLVKQTQKTLESSSSSFH